MDDELLPWFRAQIARDEQSAHAMKHAVGHIESRWSPARLLALCEAHTALLDRYDRAVAASSSVSSHVRGQDDGYREACLHSIRDVAATLDHLPGYREEWRP